jgi:hypothetical protein
VLCPDISFFEIFKKHLVVVTIKKTVTSREIVNKDRLSDIFTTIYDFLFRE